MPSGKPTQAALLALLLASPALAAPPTMESLWPHEDGRSWRYDQHYESYGPDAQVIDNQAHVWFDGTTTAPAGIQAQYLREEVTGGPVAGEVLAAVVPDRLLRAVWVARPDLRGRILHAVADLPCPEFRPTGAYALLLGGEFAWRMTADEAAAWRCNLADTRAWRWLVSDLTLGNTFTLQLVPDLAADVFLHGTIAAIEPATVPAGTFEDCVRVDYVIDYGWTQCVDEFGNVAGSTRSETRGHVHYAPNVGPVDSFEQFLVAEGTGTCSVAGVGQPLATTTMRLNSQPVPVRPTSWGRLKLTYR